MFVFAYINNTISLNFSTKVQISSRFCLHPSILEWSSNYLICTWNTLFERSLVNGNHLAPFSRLDGSLRFWFWINLAAISPTVFVLYSCFKDVHFIFSNVHLWFVLLLQKDISRKDAQKMFVKLTTGVNFTNILRALFAPILLRQKNTNLKCKLKKALREIFVRKSRT